MIWEQMINDVEAEKEKRIITSHGFNFSAAGLLFPYHLGVAHLLIEKGYIKETTPLAGASDGAILCAVIASRSSMQEGLDTTKVLADDCRRKGTAFRLGAVLRDSLEKLLSDDIHIRSNGRVCVAITQVLWRPRGLLVDQFDSKSDLINAVFTFAFIPGYLAQRSVTIVYFLCKIWMHIKPSESYSRVLMVFLCREVLAIEVLKERFWQLFEISTYSADQELEGEEEAMEEVEGILLPPQTTTKHPRHRSGCTCIVCIQSPSGKGPEHDQCCSCTVCEMVKRRKRSLLLDREKKHIEKKDNAAHNNSDVELHQSANNSKKHEHHTCSPLKGIYI